MEARKKLNVLWILHVVKVLVVQIKIKSLCFNTLK